MTTLHRLERRVDALEARVDDIEVSHGETLYKLHRASVRNDLRIGKVLDALKVQDVSDEEVDQALDES
jgi:hypothetical protein